MIRLRAVARKDLRHIAAYLEKESQSPTIAHRFYLAFMKSCEPYEKRPRLTPEIQLSGAAQPVRRFPIEGFPKYLVLYRAVEEGMVIIRVLHGARDIPLLLHD